jgi:uncharacterized protein YbjT (DUF2867 family)
VLALVTGVTGYVGGLLVPQLLERGHSVRCLVRDRTRLEQPTPGRTRRALAPSWVGQVEVVEGDVFDLDSLGRALRDVDVAYYLVHSITAKSGAAYAQRDRHAASNFGLIAREQRVPRLIYLGGLGDEKAGLSEHLASRQEVGRMLAAGGVPVTEFRAAVIVGAGSLSFRMVRYLTERLPVMITPKWVNTLTQPIAEDDVLRYLADALDQPESVGKVIEIGGADVVTYGDMITAYARLRGLHRKLIPVPLLTPSLSSHWVTLVTPISTFIARPLIEGLKTEVVVTSPLARELFPFEPVGYEEAIRRVLEKEPVLR